MVCVIAALNLDLRPGVVAQEAQRVEHDRAGARVAQEVLRAHFLHCELGVFEHGAQDLLAGALVFGHLLEESVVHDVHAAYEREALLGHLHE